MKIAYLANVGTRDIQVDGRPLEWPRQEGAELLARYDAVRARLSAPILAPGLRCVLTRARHIDRLQLFVSDQPAPPITNEEHWKKDTIELGRVLERLLKDELGSSIEQIDCRPIPHNPADYQQSIRYFSSQLPVLVPPDEFYAVWIAPIGGADASNVGLMLNAVRAYRSKCQFIYVFPDGQVQVLDLHREILDEHARQEARVHLSNRNFVALRQILEQSGLGRPWQRALCTYCDCRLRFDFSGAQAALKDARAVADGADARMDIEQCYDSLRPLLNQCVSPPDSSSSAGHWSDWLSLQRALLRELYFNLRIKVQRGEWVDFLGRLFRLSEAVLRLVFEMNTHHSTEKTGDGFSDFVRAFNANDELARYFEEKGASWQEPNNRSLMLWLSFHARRDGEHFGPVQRPLKKISELSQLRNKSILAHGYQGISPEAIEEKLGKSVTDFVQLDLRQLLIDLGIAKDELIDPFATLDSHLERV